MRIFRFEKWFADVLTPGQDYLIVFHTLLEVFGIKLCFVEVNISRFGEEKAYHLNQKLKLLKRSGHFIATTQGQINYEEDEGRIMLSLRGMDLELNISPVHPSDFSGRGMHIESRRRGSLEWKPLFLKTEVAGRICFSGEKELNEELITGTGYVDYLHSDMSPFKVPVRQLYWGRLHSEDLDLTFSYALGFRKKEDGVHSDLCGALMIVRTGGETQWLDQISVQAEGWKEYNPPGISSPVSYRMKASSYKMKLVLEVLHLKQAVVSEFAENPKELGHLRLLLLRRFMGEPKGIKFYASCKLKMELEGVTRILDEVIMIDEYVRLS